MKIIDISKGILTTPVYPGDPEPTLAKVCDRAKGDEINLSILMACVHTGTHADSPHHFLDSDNTIEKLPLEHFIGRCKVTSCIGVADEAFIDALEMNGCKILLVKDATGFSALCTQALINKDITTIGTERASIGDANVHTAILGGNIAVLENLDLSEVSDGEYFIFAPPIKIEGSDGAFVRAVLLDGFVK
ncbi:MAG: cyclase family protein [Hyphomonadaceae bacterium]|nr:cyclase family protein [Clostridia bacterium]